MPSGIHVLHRPTLAHSTHVTINHCWADAWAGLGGDLGLGRGGVGGDLGRCLGGGWGGGGLHWFLCELTCWAYEKR